MKRRSKMKLRSLFPPPQLRVCLPACICLLVLSFFSKSDRNVVSSEATSNKDNNNNNNNNNEDQTPFKCNLYMAPSSIPNAGFGVYTTRDIKAHEPITPYADTPSVIIADMEVHSGNDIGDYWSHVEYYWSGAGLGEFESDSVSENVFVLGCLSNFHTYLKNIEVRNNNLSDHYFFFRNY